MPDRRLLDPTLAAVVDALGGVDATPLDALGIDGAREAHRMLSAGAETTPVGSATDLELTGVPCRVYRPAGDEVQLPVLLWLHGGGWVLGSLDTADATARALTQRSGHLVVSVDYRLAPEFPFPAALDDVWAVTSWLAEGGATEVGGDASQVSVGGDSAGGNLAAVCALMARDAGVPLRRQVLVYPVTDLADESPSYTENGEGFLLTASTMRWFISEYVPPPRRTEWQVSPLRAPRLDGVAPAYVLTAGFDPLRDEGDAYARRLRDAGVEVVHDEVLTAVHAFLDLSAVSPLAGEAIGRIADFLAA